MFIELIRRELRDFRELFLFYFYTTKSNKMKLSNWIALGIGLLLLFFWLVWMPQWFYNITESSIGIVTLSITMIAGIGWGIIGAARHFFGNGLN